MASKHPRALRAAEMEAALIGRLKGEGNPAPVLEPAPAAPAVAVPTPAPVVAQPVPVAAPAAAPSPPTPAPSATALPPLEKTAEYYEGRIRTMAGLIQREKDERTADRIAYERQVGTRQQQVEKLLGDLEEARKTAPATVDLTKYPQEVRDAYGEEELARLDRIVEVVSARRVDAAVAPLRAELANSRQSAEQSVAERNLQARRDFDGHVDQEIPGWREWAVGDSADPRFLDWLENVDEMSGETHRSLVVRAQQRLDRNTFIKQLKAFLGSIGAKPVVSRDQPRLLPGSVNGGGEAPPPTAPAVPLITAADIQQFQKDIQHGRYRNRQKEAADMQRRIDEAFRTGQIGR